MYRSVGDAESYEYEKFSGLLPEEEYREEDHPEAWEIEEIKKAAFRRPHIENKTKGA